MARVSLVSRRDGVRKQPRQCSRSLSDKTFPTCGGGFGDCRRRSLEGPMEFKVLPVLNASLGT